VSSEKHTATAAGNIKKRKWNWLKWLGKKEKMHVKKVIPVGSFSMTIKSVR